MSSGLLGKNSLSLDLIIKEHVAGHGICKLFTFVNRCSSPWKMADGEEYTTMCGGVVTSSVRRRCCIKANHLKVRFIFNLLGQLK